MNHVVLVGYFRKIERQADVGFSRKSILVLLRNCQFMYTARDLRKRKHR